MILLDTHVWVWWVHGNPRLRQEDVAYLDAASIEGLAISVISCWEVAKLVSVGRLILPQTAAEWIDLALAYPGVQIAPLTPEVAVASAYLPGNFHRDPADQIIVATSRVRKWPLATADSKILNYPHVNTLKVGS